MPKLLAGALTVLTLTIITLVASLPIRQQIASALHLGSTGPDFKVADVLASNGQFDPNASQAIYDNQQVSYPGQELSALFNPPNLAMADSNVLGTTNSNGEEKWIEVDLQTQTLRAWEGNKVVMEFLISSGKWGPTPTGTFNIWYKTKSQRMVGGSKALGDFYDLPNVPYNMFFSGGYAVHGAYWHNNFGHPMSHGCINTPVDKAEALFAWTGPIVPDGQNYIQATPDNPGTRVVIH